MPPSPPFLPGLELARGYYTDVVRPLLGDRPHAAARLGPGSDVLGHDTARSTDHDWGPRLEIFTDLADLPGLSAELARELPVTYRGRPTHFTPHRAHDRTMTPIAAGPVDHYITVTPFTTWATDLLGFDPTHPLGTLDWLATPWQRLAELTGGAVFHDPDGTLTTTRSRLAWYPDDLWRHVLACQWRRIAQEEPFPARAAEAGDDLGARVTTARLCRDIARLLLLQTRRWPPYQKWLMTAAATEPGTDSLHAAMTTTDPAAREDHLCTALETAATRQNDLALSPAQPPTRRPFHSRDHAVIGADRYATALRRSITDPAIAALPPTGSADQLTDNTDILTTPARCRALTAATLT